MAIKFKILAAMKSFILDFRFFVADCWRDILTGFYVLIIVAMLIFTQTKNKDQQEAYEQQKEKIMLYQIKEQQLQIERFKADIISFILLQDSLNRHNGK